MDFRRRVAVGTDRERPVAALGRPGAAVQHGTQAAKMSPSGLAWPVREHRRPMATCQNQALSRKKHDTTDPFITEAAFNRAGFLS